MAWGAAGLACCLHVLVACLLWRAADDRRPRPGAETIFRDVVAPARHRAHGASRLRRRAAASEARGAIAASPAAIHARAAGGGRAGAIGRCRRGAARAVAGRLQAGAACRAGRRIAAATGVTAARCRAFALVGVRAARRRARA